MARKKGFYNKYVIEGNITRIEVINKKGEKFEIIIDTKNLQLLIDLNYAWHVIRRCGHLLYASAYHYVGTYETGHPVYEQILMHNLIGGVSNRAYTTDHINHNTLDNREQNLRVVKAELNSKNRKGKNKNNKSGYRNVSVVNGKFRVQLSVNGKNIKFGDYDTPEQAAEVAEENRRIYYGEFAGEG